MSRWVTTLLIVQFLLAILWLAYHVEIKWVDQADCQATVVEHRIGSAF